MMDTNFNIDISFVVGTHNEGKIMLPLVENIMRYVKDPTHNAELVMVDDFSTDSDTLDILSSMREVSSNIRVIQHALNKDYAAHKNYMNSVCRGRWICNIDADELLPVQLLESLTTIATQNPTIDAFRFPRVNTVAGLTLSHVRQWQWPITTFDDMIATAPIASVDMALLDGYKLTINKTKDTVTYLEPIVAWPDYQTRLYRNSPFVNWTGVVHEQIVGMNITIAPLPIEREYAIWHHKTISRQETQNAFYTQLMGA